MPISDRPFRSPSNAIQPTRSRPTVPILAVGRRVFVTCPSESTRHVTVTDSTGNTALATLADGAEVEILAWQPRGSGGTRYRVRLAEGAIQGWVSAANLRAPVPPAVPPPAPRPSLPADVRPRAVAAERAAPKTARAKTSRRS
jgi:hypothetical protein